MKDYNHYNDRVKPETAERLLALNRCFYEERGRDFSATRMRIQPGVKRLVDRLDAAESILDLGCGNGELARSLSRLGHRGPYLGLDSSEVLLAEAAASSFSFPVHFAKADLSAPTWDRAVTDDATGGTPRASWLAFDMAFCFAVLHHVPGSALRSNILCRIHDLLADDGRLALSNWRFTQSPRMSRRVQPWSVVGLEARDVEIGDYLLDWKRGGTSLRYVHEFDEAELARLAASSGFGILETFYSDGADHRSSIYQIWRKVRG